MNIVVDGDNIFVATGGCAFDPKKPTVVFIHGSGLDHRSWALQARWFAFHGFSVFAPDLPGHSLSEGKPLKTIDFTMSVHGFTHHKNMIFDNLHDIVRYLFGIDF